jgi:hypothetical protein
MTQASTQVNELIREYLELDRDMPSPGLGEYGPRSKEIRQELVEMLRPEGYGPKA